MTLDELIQKYTDSSGKWVRTEDVKEILQYWLGYHKEQTNGNFGQH